MKPPLRGLIFRNVHLGVFDFGVHVIIGPHAAGVKYARWQLEDAAIDPPNEARGRFYARPGYSPVIWLPKRPTSARDYATVAHEALHAVSLVMRWAAIDHSEATEEVFAHALSYLVTQIGQM